jgi:hypothetical protein
MITEAFVNMSVVLLSAVGLSCLAYLLYNTYTHEKQHRLLDDYLRRIEKRLPPTSNKRNRSA